MTEFTVRIIMRNHRILDAGWTQDVNELPKPGEAIEVTFDVPDEHAGGHGLGLVYAVVTDVHPDEAIAIDATEVEPRDNA